MGLPDETEYERRIMDYKVSNGDKNFSIQELANIVGQSAVTVNGLAETVNKGFADITKRVDRISSDMSEMRADIRVLKEDEEIRTKDVDLIENLIRRKVVEVLELPLDVPRYKWTDEQVAYYNLYARTVFGALYTEVRKKGHLAGKTSRTRKKDLKDAINDIETWYPFNGLETLKRKAEKDRVAKLDADKMALKRTGRVTD